MRYRVTERKERGGNPRRERAAPSTRRRCRNLRPGLAVVILTAPPLEKIAREGDVEHIETREEKEGRGGRHHQEMSRHTEEKEGAAVDVLTSAALEKFPGRRRCHAHPGRREEREEGRGGGDGREETHGLE